MFSGKFGLYLHGSKRVMQALGVLAVKTSELNNYIDIYNLGAFCTNQIVETKLSATVVLADIWEKPPIEIQDATSSERFFFIIEKNEAIGIVLDMGVSDIHWFMKPAWRKKGKLCNALKEVIFPYLFNKKGYESLETQFNSEENKKYLERLGFVLSKDKMKLYAENVSTSKVDEMLNKLSSDDVEIIRRDLAIAANLIISVSDRLKSCGKNSLSEYLSDLGRELHEEASHEILNSK
ncbi:hypothetical protein [Aliivibrio fischeri]|uniref:hypothetical protein n=1 Tax=Aliivibrio fischeri TaxID=668 RepID=UPI0018C556EC|nr:hypothetical protein [Aliivibrio fischeri]